MRYLKKAGIITLIAFFLFGVFGRTEIGANLKNLFTNFPISFIPDITNTIDLGSLSKMFRSAYIYNSAYIGSSAIRIYQSGSTLATTRLKYMRFTIPTPSILYGFDTQVCLVPALTNPITVTKIQVTLDADPTTEVAGDLKYADAFIGLANPTLINDIDTTAGVRVDTSITSGSVAAGKCLYIDFDASPDDATTQMSVIITYTVTE